MEKIITAELFINVLLQDATVLMVFFPETTLYVMTCAAFVFILVSGSFTWHLKFLNQLVISLIQEDNKNLHPATTFLV